LLLCRDEVLTAAMTNSECKKQRYKPNRLGKSQHGTTFR
jgi:hypothetical protein